MQLMLMQLVYSGITAGEGYGYTGGGVNYLCLTEEPEYLVLNQIATLVIFMVQSINNPLCQQYQVIKMLHV